MRSGILCTLLFFVFVYLLRFPEDAFQASASGVTLWFFHVLPSLLSFMILSDFFIHTGLASVLLQKTKGNFSVFCSVCPCTDPMLFCLGSSAVIPWDPN